MATELRQRRQVFCVYLAPNEQHLFDQARRAGVPADAVLVISREIDATTAGASCR